MVNRIIQIFNFASMIFEQPNSMRAFNNFNYQISFDEVYFHENGVLHYRNWNNVLKWRFDQLLFLLIFDW